MKKLPIPHAIALSLSLLSTTAFAGDVNITVTIENLSPTNGTNQTPHWVGFHDGTFDLYNGGTPASFLPIEGSRAIEQLAEDGNNAGVAADFATLQPIGVDATIAGPNGPIAPGEVATMTFTLDTTNPGHRFFSYGSMVLPSNDFWYANGNPLAHPIFDDNGNFIAQDFIVSNLDVLDAGTEINDEIPENTAFFGQSAPNTGVDENGVILDFGDASDLVRFRSVEEGGNILADERFSMADFALENYPLVKISFSSEPVEQPQIFDDSPLSGPLLFLADLDGASTVPQVNTNARGRSAYGLTRDGNRILFVNAFSRLQNITMAHLHLGRIGETGPVVVNLLPNDFDAANSRQQRHASRLIKGEITSEDLVGPLEGLSISALARQIQNGSVYVNIHTEQNPSGEIRGQLAQKTPR